MEVTSRVAAAVAPAQMSTPPPLETSLQRPLPRLSEDVASHVTMTNLLERCNKGGGAVEAAGEEGGDEEGGVSVHVLHSYGYRR